MRMVCLFLLMAAVLRVEGAVTVYNGSLKGVTEEEALQLLDEVELCEPDIVCLDGSVQTSATKALLKGYRLLVDGENFWIACKGSIEYPRFSSLRDGCDLFDGWIVKEDSSPVHIFVVKLPLSEERNRMNWVERVFEEECSVPTVVCFVGQAEAPSLFSWTGQEVRRGGALDTCNIVLCGGSIGTSVTAEKDKNGNESATVGADVVWESDDGKTKVTGKIEGGVSRDQHGNTKTEASATGRIDWGF